MSSLLLSDVRFVIAEVAEASISTSVSMHVCECVRACVRVCVCVLTLVQRGLILSHLFTKIGELTVYRKFYLNHPFYTQMRFARFNSHRNSLPSLYYAAFTKLLLHALIPQFC